LAVSAVLGSCYFDPPGRGEKYCDQANSASYPQRDGK